MDNVKVEVLERIDTREMSRGIVSDMMEVAIMKGEMFAMPRIQEELRLISEKDKAFERASMDLVNNMLNWERLRKVEQMKSWWISRRDIQMTDISIGAAEDNEGVHNPVLRNGMERIWIREGWTDQGKVWVTPEERFGFQVENLLRKRKRNGKLKYKFKFIEIKVEDPVEQMEGVQDNPPIRMLEQVEMEMDMVGKQEEDQMVDVEMSVTDGSTSGVLCEGYGVSPGGQNPEPLMEPEDEEMNYDHEDEVNGMVEDGLMIKDEVDGNGMIGTDQTTKEACMGLDPELERDQTRNELDVEKEDVGLVETFMCDGRVTVKAR